MVFVSEDASRERLTDLGEVDDLTASGALQLRSVKETYAAGLDVDAQRRMFEALLAEAIADGYTGLSVVADNSSLAAGSDAEFASWLEWEGAADVLQASQPIVGVCYFDRCRVRSERLADLSVLHPVLSADFTPPSFRLFVDGDVLCVVGSLDYFCVEQLRRIIEAAPSTTELVLDVSELEFFDHNALWTLNDLSRSGRPIRLLGAKEIVHRVWNALDVRSPALTFC